MAVPGKERNPPAMPTDSGPQGASPQRIWPRRNFDEWPSQDSLEQPAVTGSIK